MQGVELARTLTATKTDTALPMRDKRTSRDSKIIISHQVKVASRLSRTHRGGIGACVETNGSIRLSDPLVLQELTRQRETLEKIETKLDRFDVRLSAVEKSEPTNRTLSLVALVVSAAALVVSIITLITLVIMVLP